MSLKVQASDQIARPQWLSTAEWPFTLRCFEHRNELGQVVNIHYTDEGTGPTLVLVHAGMWSFIWRDAITLLRANFRCITVDFPGTGLSGGDLDDIQIDTYPQILDSVLDACNVQEATFVVHDLGGVVGIQAAALRPGQVSGIVAANSFSWAPNSFGLRTMLKVMGSRFATASLGSMRLIPRMTRSGMGVGRHFDDSDRAAFFGPYRSRTNGRNFHRTMRSARRATDTFAEAEAALSGQLSRVPVLTIFGEKNDQFGFAKRWKELFPTATQWTVEGGNHFPMCDDPRGFADHLTAWHKAGVAGHLAYSA